MTKRINPLITLLIIIVILSLSSCSNKDETDYDYKTDDILAAVTKTADALPEMKTVNAAKDSSGDSFGYICEMDYSKIADYSFTYSKDGKADEICIIKVKNKDDLAELEVYLEDRVETRKNMYKTYLPEQVPTVENYKLSTKGSYACLAICGQSSDAINAFNDYFK